MLCLPLTLGACLLLSQVAPFPPHARVLFQGDSITDMSRGRNDDPNHILGHSYAFLIAAETGAKYPERQIEFINRGVSGDKISDLVARWKTDCLDLKPTILSILVGVNDADHDVPNADYEAAYDRLLADTKHALPTAKIVLCEPFMLPTGWRKPMRYPHMWPGLKSNQATVRRLAAKYHTLFVPLQKAFDQAAKRAPAEFWIWDSVHPTYAGQQIIADAWVKVVGKAMR